MKNRNHILKLGIVNLIMFFPILILTSFWSILFCVIFCIEFLGLLVFIAGFYFVGYIGSRY